MSEYKDLVRRVQERYGVKRPSCRLDLKELQAFLDSKLKYEQTFRKLAYGDRLLKSDLHHFFTACDLHPTEGEIQQAFEKVFKGGNNTAEVIFLLDCSTSVTPMCFHYLTEFVKSVVESFTIGPDNIRVGVVPFSDDVYQAFGINKYNMTYQICAAIDNIGHKEGLTRTDLALKEMKKLFMCSRPGVQKIAIIVTDGKSTCPERTLQNARDVKENNINVITIGVGSHVDLEELKHIASSEKNVFSVYDYSSLHKLRDVISRRTCLDDKVKKSTDINTCLRLVIQTKIEREGFITLPSDVREGVEQVSDPDLALEKVHKWIEEKKKVGETFQDFS